MVLITIDIIIYIMSGFLIAIVSTMAGIGGGAFMVPLFYFLGLEINNAVGTSKFVITFLSFVGAMNYLRLKKVPIKPGLFVLIGMIPSSYIGAYTSNVLDQGILRFIVSIFIIFYSIRLIYKYVSIKLVKRTKEDPKSSPIDLNNIHIPWIKAVPIGLMSGFVAGLTGTGGGVINMPLFLGILNIPIHSAVALSTFIIFPSSIAATARHILNGDVIYRIGIPFALGAILGANIGPRIAGKMSRDRLRLVVGIILLYAGVRMLLSVLG
ncbi:MAG: sulfite exporter TauE/SafE family protein [Thermoprotei archaeon]|nr:MAG: sulfite exporter TauE/SafE family protein [Thermoprotei archaeon]